MGQDSKVPTGSQKSRNPEIQISRNPDIQKSRYPEIQISRNPDIQKSREHEDIADTCNLQLLARMRRLRPHGGTG